MIIENCTQGDETWFALRAGRPTASCFDQILTPKTMKPSAQAKKYLYTLAGERITGAKAESFQSDWMKRGIEVEAEAKVLFSWLRDVEVQEVGLVYQDDKRLYSASPDGLLVGETAGLELKCPAMHTQVGYLLDGSLPGDYIPQVQGSMFITGYPRWFFLSYYPGLPPFIIEVPRDDKWCATLKVTLNDFCEELDRVEAKLRALA